MPDRYQGSYDAVVPRAPNYGDIRSSPTTYPTEYISHPSQMSYSYPSVPGPHHHSSHLPTVHHSPQMSYSTAERGLPTQVDAQGPYARESTTNIKPTKESAPVMANEEPTINEMRNAAQLTVLNDSCTHTSLSSTGEHAKLVRFQNEQQPIPGPQSSRKFPPLNMPNRYQIDSGAVAPQVPNYGDIHLPNTTHPAEYAPYPSQASCTYPPAPDPRRHSSHLRPMHHSQYTLLPTTYSSQNNAQMSMQPDHLENAPVEQHPNQESSRFFALDSLQDLTKDLHTKSSFANASGGFGDIWKCYLVKSNGIIEVGPASSIP
ncbi:hypothetical protein M405DRAFT_514031 [Rhizopogon salebrosus TDB-379]|nr:hypothetical protein M405DRAFT_514031 [Rhizopogon salebrosus TDB-379]